LKIFYPDLYVSDFSIVNFDLLRKHSIKGVIFDIDNTLAKRGEDMPSDGVAAHIKDLLNRDIMVALISNNSYKRAETFAGNLQTPFYASARKPFISKLLKAKNEFGLKSENIAMVGDQIFTDVIAGNRAKMFTVLVSPIVDEEDFLFKIKRMFEKPILRKLKLI